VINFKLRAFYLLERTPLPTEEESEWTAELVWTFWRRKNSLHFSNKTSHTDFHHPRQERRECI